VASVSALERGSDPLSSPHDARLILLAGEAVGLAGATVAPAGDVQTCRLLFDCRDARSPPGSDTKPHQTEAFKLSPDPQFIDKVRDIVGLYLNPPDAAVVLCVDEKSQIQALDRSAPVLPLMPGVPERHTHDYVRNGTTNLYAALDVASGQVIADMTPRHRAEEFRRFLNLIDSSVPAHLDVHVVLDNSSTHKTPSIQRWLVRHPRFTLHFTPTYSSWLNLVERWFAELTTKWIKRSAHRSVRDLVASIRTWITNWNEDPKPYVWHKTADEILSSLASYCQRISDSGH
jgi:transposase